LSTDTSVGPRRLVRRHMAPWRILCPLVLAYYFAQPASAVCNTGDWVEEYGGERCWILSDEIVMSCNSKFSGADCGMRLRSVQHMGRGVHSVKLKAAPGAGVSSNFYLATYNFFNDRTKPWCEIDFELLGMRCTPQGTQIWTNFLTGQGTEHSKEILVPFDASADFHTYTIDTSNNLVKWLVDGIVYRAEDVSFAPDMVNTINSWQFGAFLSLWGRSSSEPTESWTTFWDKMGVLNSNNNLFPVHASFKAEWNPALPGTTSLTSTLSTTQTTTEATTQMPTSTVTATTQTATSTVITEMPTATTGATTAPASTSPLTTAVSLRNTTTATTARENPTTLAATTRAAAATTSAPPPSTVATTAGPASTTTPAKPAASATTTPAATTPPTMSAFASTPLPPSMTLEAAAMILESSPPQTVAATTAAGSSTTALLKSTAATTAEPDPSAGTVIVGNVSISAAPEGRLRLYDVDVAADSRHPGLTAQLVEHAPSLVALCLAACLVVGLARASSRAQRRGFIPVLDDTDSDVGMALPLTNRALAQLL